MYLKLGAQKIKVIEKENLITKIKQYYKNTEKDYGVLLKNTNRTTTYLEREVMDIIGLNEQNQVVYIYKEVSPNEIVKIHKDNNVSILKMPSNLTKKIKIGSILIFKNEDVI